MEKFGITNKVIPNVNFANLVSVVVVSIKLAVLIPSAIVDWSV